MEIITFFLLYFMIEADQIRFVLALVLAAPLSYLIRKLPDYQMRFWYSFIVGTLLQFFVYGVDIWMSFVAHLVIYQIIKIRGRKCGALITGLSIFSLSVYHIYRLIVDYGNWTLDISTVFMPMVCKYSLFAYAYQDGGESE